ncbi:hypothetical protein NNJEOMEG_02784 [Fundidesulfovibrio magnetotacticus]|uniref:Uncharacterized protein n=1 Tax=Fundidesulfovibrio magnetotacticus TaxID=2730080 RepID=A0A6V8LYS0_9BACT|nr:DUF268 domain-containing protein [Fundidesulfovibrio magnetotacticus]GFK94936.1 hypothetical protein NNJEOMEG_02784 [Fundidesulfovibrio magnetotacticus]
MDHAPLLTDLASPQDLPPGARVVLYGAGDYGRHYLARLRESRPDLRPVCFLDTFRPTGESLDGLPVVNVDDFDFRAEPVEVVVTAAGVEAVAAVLAGRGPTRCHVPVVSLRGAHWFAHRDLFENPRPFLDQAQGHRFWENVYRWRYLALCREHFGPPEAPAPLVTGLTPEEVRRFTMDGRAALRLDVRDQRLPVNHALFYTDEELDDCLARIEQGDATVYAALDRLIRLALREHPVQGASVAVFGSTSPWYEAMCLHHGARPVTVEYAAIVSRSPRLRTITVEALKAGGETFDHALSISSFEHDGLGAYGDPVDPDADLEAMRLVHERLNPGGLLFLNVPVAGNDSVHFNGCRVYGRHRLPLLLRGFRVAGAYGYDIKRIASDPDARFEPLFVLRKDRPGSPCDLPAAPAATPPEETV